MGKANKMKAERDNVIELVSLIGVLKDVADNKFYALAAQKDRFARFGESFVEFFRMISFSAVSHPLVNNNYPPIGILVVTSESGFLGDLNSRVVRTALAEKTKYPNTVMIVVGKKGAAIITSSMKVEKVFEDMETVGLYETALLIKDYLVAEVMAERLGKVVAIYPWPKNFNVQKPKVIKLLPCEELLAKQSELVDTIEKVIEESDPVDTIGYLADMWLSCRIYEMLYDTIIAAAAAQSQQLDSSLTKMQKEKKVVQLKYRKAKKGDIDNSMREVFSARIMSQRQKK